MAIVYYVSAHGLGHAIRSSAIINQIPEEIPVVIRSLVPEHVWESELRRACTFEPAAFDTGAVHVDGFTIDAKETLYKFEETHRQNARQKNSELEFLKSAGARLVVSDIASFPLAVAREGGLASVAVGNFTWADIYEPLAAEYPSFQSTLEEMRVEYGMADLGMKLPMSLPMAGLGKSGTLPLVCRKGTSIRPAIAGWLDIDPEAKWGLVYLGQHASAFDWSRLANVPGWQFLYISREKSEHAGIAAIDPGRYSIPDVFASCQAIVGKSGYGTVADAIAADVPMVYAPPTNFAEGIALEEGIKFWGRGVKVSVEQLYQGELVPAIEQALATKAKKKFELDGAEVAAEFLEETWKESK